MALNCPKCNHEISKDHINIQTDLAQCQFCDHLFQISNHISSSPMASISSTVANPSHVSGAHLQLPELPTGVWHTNDLQYTILGATTRSYIALFLVPFLLFWSNGVISVDMLQGEAEFPLFILPFIVIGTVFWWLALMSVFGKVEIKADSQGGQIFVGIWKIGRYKKFEWKDISAIEEESNMFTQYPGNSGAQIVMSGRTRYNFASGVSQARRYYLVQTLKNLHAKYTR